VKKPDKWQFEAAPWAKYTGDITSGKLPHRKCWRVFPTFLEVLKEGRTDQEEIQS